MKTKTKYRIKNWAKYNQALKQRGSLELWINADLLDSWRAEPSGPAGNQPIYSDFAIQIPPSSGTPFRKGRIVREAGDFSLELSVVICGHFLLWIDSDLHFFDGS